MKRLTFSAMTTIIAIAVLFGVSAAGPHYHGCSGMKMSDLSEMDTDNDGVISFEEFSAPHLEQSRKAFDIVDSSENGEVDQDEWNHFLEVHGYSSSSES